MAKEYIVPIGEELFSVNTGDWRTSYPALEKTSVQALRHLSHELPGERRAPSRRQDTGSI